MKRLLSILLCMTLLLTTVLTGCTKDAEKGKEGKEEIALSMITVPLFETEANVVRDQLKKVGFNVNLNILPDYSSLFTQVDARNYDIMLLSMKVLTGNPDYAVRSMLRSDGVDNQSKVVNPEVDRLIDLGASMLPKDYLDAYTQLEKVIVEENAYFVPVCRMMNSYGYNKELIREDTMRVGQSKYQYWTEIDYNDPEKRETTPLVFTSSQALAHFDPLTTMGTHRLLANTNIKLVELTDNDEITTNGSLSYNYAIAEGNSEFYFVLRDNVNFSKAVDKKAVDTGVRVGAEDVIFTLDRARNKDSVPGNKVYDNYQIIKSMERINDISVLENAKESGSGKTVKEALEAGLPAPIKGLMDSKESVNNKEGKYEVIKLTTKESFPQILNFLCGYDVGILCKKQVESINKFDVAKYDASKDVRYGDANLIFEGPNYNNHLYCSGPYTILYANDYEVVAERNPGYMPGTDSVGKIKTVKTKIISDMDAAISALRSGEIHIADVPSNLINVVKGDSKLGLVSSPINGVVNIQFNLDENKVTSNADIRKAILYSVNQNEIIAVKDGMAGKAYTTLTMLNTGNEHNADPAKAAEHISNYYKSIGK